MEKKSSQLELILLGIKGHVPAADALNAIAGETATPLLREFNEVSANMIFQRAAMDSFVLSNPEGDNYKNASPIPMGLAAEHLVMFLTGLDEERMAIGVSSIQYIPFLSVVGQIEEMFIKMKKEAIKIDQKDGVWPLFLKTMALPLDDRYYTERSSNLIVRAASQALRKLSELFEEYNLLLHYETGLNPKKDGKIPELNAVTLRQRINALRTPPEE